MKKQSSIEWLVSEIQRHIDAGYKFNPKYNEQIIEQAKEKHKQEIIESWCNGYDEEDRATSNPLTYYKKTYEKEN